MAADRPREVGIQLFIVFSFKLLMPPAFGAEFCVKLNFAIATLKIRYFPYPIQLSQSFLFVT